MARQRQEVVIDSSVAVKWFSPEEDTEKALSLRDQHLKGTRHLWACDLLYHEVANALRFKRTYDENKLNDAIDSLFAFHINSHAVNSTLLKTAATISYRGGVTIYDALPVALAQMRGTVCITADEETQFKKLKADGYPIELLANETIEDKIYPEDPIFKNIERAPKPGKKTQWSVDHDKIL